MRLLHITTTVTFFAADDVILAAEGSRWLQSGSTLTMYDDFRYSHALLSQRPTCCDLTTYLQRQQNGVC